MVEWVWVCMSVLSVLSCAQAVLAGPVCPAKCLCYLCVSQVFSTMHRLVLAGQACPATCMYRGRHPQPAPETCIILRAQCGGAVYAGMHTLWDQRNFVGTQQGCFWTSSG
eukprot:1136709-Pelagomonas_calceolata.AAC.3